MLKVAIIHNLVTNESAVDESDVIIQAQAVADALIEIGHQPVSVMCDLDLKRLKERLGEIQPDMVFNLVESLDGYGNLIYLVPCLLYSMGIPYTGSPSESIFLSSHKLMAKERMQMVNLPTPAWIGPYPQDVSSWFRDDFSPEKREKTTWIIKSVWEHGSIGLDNQAIFDEKTGNKSVKEYLHKRALQLNDMCFAEQYIEGREFNISLLSGPEGHEVLPHAEILFDEYDNSRLRIVDYAAKWDDKSYEYHHTPRCFDFPATDKSLLTELSTIAIQCWQVFGLEGYARIDFRVDDNKIPRILEVNTNPCLSPDAGFTAAVEHAGLSFVDAVERILDNAITRKSPGNFKCPLDRKKHVVQKTSYNKRLSDPKIVFRYNPLQKDIEDVRQLISATGFSNPSEINVAVELVEERLTKGEKSDYNFVFIEQDNRLLGYSCFGLIPCTVSSYDLYWIAIHPDFKRKGLGRIVLNETERLIYESNGTRIYIETSQRSHYSGTRSFYEQCGYNMVSILKDFYALEDGKVIYSKTLANKRA
jgi:D-alanine-D-alanine ligase